MKVRLQLYHDRVAKRIAAKKRRVLFKQGAYLRTTMQRSMRYSNKPSKPGQPPHARRNNPLLRKLIEFVVLADSVICGPKLFAGSKVKSNEPLPELLDTGGNIRTEINGVSVTQQVAPRPFTQPVFTDGGERFRQLIAKESL